jgi:murein DD-endopeptidase MepM/ murein hydrolase activator NlpD
MNYTVRNRDTLTSIARRFGTTVDALAQANHIADPNKILAGQKLQVPGSRDDFDENSVVSQVTNSKRATQATSQAETAAGAQGVASNHRSILHEMWRHPIQAGRDAIDAVRGRPLSGEAAQANGQTTVHTRTPWYNQMEGGHGFVPGSTACFRAASAMARAGGATVHGPGDGIQVATRRDANGHVTANPAAAQRGISHIDSELNAGRPVVIGVTHPGGRGHNMNSDHVTDHFVTVTGRGVDEQGHVYYTINDPGTRFGQDSRSTNRMYIDPSNGNLYKPSSALPGLGGQRYELTTVR